MKTSTLIASSLVAASQLFGAFAQSSGGSACSVSPPKQEPSSFPVPGSPVSQGCYTSAGNMTDADLESTGVSSGSCREYCIEEGFYVFALHGSKCLCGFAMPSSDDRSDDENCNYPCPAFCPEACGSLGDPGYYSVFNLGEEMDPPVYEEESSTTSSSAVEETTAPADDDGDDDAEQPAITTPPAEETSSSDSEEESSGPNVGAIVGGVVVGVVVLLGAAGGLFFYMRRKRNSEIEEEHRRNAAVNAFISGSKPPGSSGSISMTDSRLDPIMAHRRLSDGSIADNEDYSRKILRVTNA